MGSKDKFQPDGTLRLNTDLIYLLRLATPYDHLVPDIKILSDVQCCYAHKHIFLR